MTISKFSKILFIIHKDERESFLKYLQERGVVEITELKEKNVVETFPELGREDSKNLNDLVALTSQIDFAINFLKPYEKKRSPLSFLSPKGMKSTQDLAYLANRYNVKGVLDKVSRLNREITENKNQIAKLEAAAESLTPWLDIDVKIDDLRDTKNVFQILFMIYKFPREKIEEALTEAGDSHVLTPVSQETNYSYYHFVCHKDDRQVYEEALASIEIEKETLPDFPGTFKSALKKLQKEIDVLKKKDEKLKNEASVIAAERDKLESLYDHFTIEKEREEVLEEILFSSDVSYVEGWIPEGSISALEGEISEKFSLVEMIPFPHTDEEQPPILLENRKGVRPFEIITELYGMPDPKEVDPTPLFTPFYAIFFGLCLTDAGYGLILIALLLFVILKFKNTLGKTKLVRLLLWGSISTVILGSLMGGWFGDVLVRLPEGSFLQRLFVSVKMMDPLEDTLTFMLICLVLGFIQINFGIMVRMYKNIKRGIKSQAIFVQGGWILFINSAAVLLAGFMAGSIPAVVTKAATIGIIAAAISIILFSHTESKNIFVRIAWGIYAIYGSTSYMGDLLSYLRLLALGLATGIIATVVNLIAIMVGGIPYVGFIFAALVLIGGHTFNIAVNALGAFVHTTRLQYVEFFSKFYEGGGRPFKPFGIEPKYVLLKEAKD